MKPFTFILLISSYFLWPACQHPDFVLPTDPDPIDTTAVLTCEDTIEINLPGTMENGFVSAIKTCRDWKASGSANKINSQNNYLFISGLTYIPYIGSNGDTTYYFVEGMGMTIPKKSGKFPVVSEPGFRQDTVRINFSYWDVDVSVADWVVDNSYPQNEFEITELDLVQKRVKGKFNVHFKIDTTGFFYQSYPSKLHFYEGEFDVKIVD
jgi:hypothetical protein